MSDEKPRVDQKLDNRYPIPSFTGKVVTEPPPIRRRHNFLPASDKRTDPGTLRYSRRMKDSCNVMLAACTCGHHPHEARPGGVCSMCGGAELTDLEAAHARTRTRG